MAEEKQEEHPPPDPVVLPDRPPIQRVQSVSDAFAGPVDVVSDLPKIFNRRLRWIRKCAQVSVQTRGLR